MAKKRHRESAGVNTQLIEIYEDLAHETEQVRLKAARLLLSKFADPNSIAPEQCETILKRLFRGLCSSRKAARLGFSIALTEYLSQVFPPLLHQQKLDGSQIIDILESQTAIGGGTSGQDERDHYFGRLFGAEAIIKSAILFAPGLNVDDWERLLGIVCNVASRKPWLRQECGWLLYTGISTVPQHFKRTMLEQLDLHKLVRTPEGIAIWLELNHSVPIAELLPQLWKYGHPLSRKDKSTLADILKDARSKQLDLDGKLESQGRAMWSPQLHFMWEVVLRELYRPVDEQPKQIPSKSEDKHLSFDEFWLQVVDQGLLGASSSIERKHWGLLLFSKVISEAPQSLLGDVFSDNALNCLKNSLGGEDRYLQRTAKRAIQAMLARVDQEPAVALDCLHGILGRAGMLAFDALTKTKIIEKLIFSKDSQTQRAIVDYLGTMFRKPGLADEKDVNHSRKFIIGLLFTICVQDIDERQKQHTFPHDKDEMKQDFSSMTEQRPARISRHVMEVLAELAYFPGADEPPQVTSTQQYVRERIQVCIERALRIKGFGRSLLRQTIAWIVRLESGKSSATFEFDDKIQAIVRNSQNRLYKIQRNLRVPQNSGQQDYEEIDSNDNDREAERDNAVANGVGEAHQNGSTSALVLLYHLTLLQVYNEEAEAVEILEDLNHHYDLFVEKKEDSIRPDALVEVLLSFASKPSKLLRRISLQAFGAFASQITRDGLQSLIRVLETKESVKGQQEIFDAEAVINNDEDEGSTDSEDDSEPDMAGSDVEMMSEAGSSLLDQTEEMPNGNDSEEEEESGEDDEDADELAAFDAKLAAALGTRKGEEDIGASDTSGSSDQSMSDSEMEALDDKLAEVFRERNLASTTKNPKKKEQRDAKETIVNFKNRVLDLIEVFLKQEHLNALSLALVLPLLTLARSTPVKQLADRACSVVRDFCNRSKGSRLPQLLDHGAGGGALSILRAIHAEAGREGSNAHAGVCSSASILLVKTLVSAGVDVRSMVDVYAETRTRSLTDRKCHVQPSLFTDWNNWCANARKTMAK